MFCFSVLARETVEACLGAHARARVLEHRYTGGLGAECLSPFRPGGLDHVVAAEPCRCSGTASVASSGLGASTLSLLRNLVVAPEHRAALHDDLCLAWGPAPHIILPRPGGLRTAIVLHRSGFSARSMSAVLYVVVMSCGPGGPSSSGLCPPSPHQEHIIMFGLLFGSDASGRLRSDRVGSCLWMLFATARGRLPRVASPSKLGGTC